MTKFYLIQNKKHESIFFLIFQPSDMHYVHLGVFELRGWNLISPFLYDLESPGT